MTRNRGPDLQEELGDFGSRIAESAPVIIAVHDKENHIVWANAAYRAATGLTPEEIIGRKCFSVWGLSQPCLAEAVPSSLFWKPARRPRLS